MTSAAHGVRSTLSLPIVRDGGSSEASTCTPQSPDAFDGKHEALAMALGASAEGAVADADLEFASRARAVQTPATMADLRTVDMAVGILAARERTDVDTARARLEDSATRAGVSLVQAAKVVSWLRAPKGRLANGPE